MSSIFHFKQFSIDQSRCAMKVGTDGVLLGAWTESDSPQNILDVGTGSGLIALMMAQKFPQAHITAIDIAPEAVEQAALNARNSIWSERIDVFIDDFNNPMSINNKVFDLIVSNPPFYVENVKSPDSQRDMARRSESLPLDNLFSNASKLTNDQGCLSIILPTAVVEQAVGEAALHGLYLKRRTDVRTTPAKPPKRTLLEFSKKIIPSKFSVLVLNVKENMKSNEYALLTHQFYLDK